MKPNEPNEPNEKSNPGPPVRRTEPSPETLRARVLDLVALLSLLTLATTVFLAAGAVAFTVVTSVGVGLFSAWRQAR
jgi:hypothetical protein